MWNRREDRREAVFGFEGTERIILDSSMAFRVFGHELKSEESKGVQETEDLFFL